MTGSTGGLCVPWVGRRSGSPGYFVHLDDQLTELEPIAGSLPLIAETIGQMVRDFFEILEELLERQPVEVISFSANPAFPFHLRSMDDGFHPIVSFCKPDGSREPVSCEQQEVEDPAHLCAAGP
jgi:hypothetical protein